MKWNNKTLMIILGVLAIISVALLIKDRSVERADEIFYTIDSAKVTEISVKAKEGNVLLRREGTEWRMKEPKDNDIQLWSVQSLLKSLDTLEVEYVVSDEPAKWKDFGVDDAAGAHVTVKASGKSYEFIVGTLGPTWRHTHMRKPGDNKVYLVKGAIRSNIVKNPDDWRDRKVFVYNQDSCATFMANFADKKGNYTVTREDSQWVITPEKGKKFKPDETAIVGIMSAILRISIGEFVPDSIKPKIDFGQELAQYHFAMKDGTKQGIAFYKYPNNEQKVIFKVEGKEEPFTAWKATYDVIGKKAEELTPEFAAKKKKRETEGVKKAHSVVEKSQKKAAAAKRSEKK